MYACVMQMVRFLRVYTVSMHSVSVYMYVQYNYVCIWQVCNYVILYV